MGYNNGLSDAIAEEVLNHCDFASSVESVIEDYNMDDKINSALKDHDFGVSNLSDRVDNVENLAEDAISRVYTLENERDETHRLIESLTKRIEQLENATAGFDWDELLKL